MHPIGRTLLLALGLTATGHSQDFRFGVQGLAASPLKGFEKHSEPRTPATPLGTGFGLNLDLLLPQGQVLRLRLDLLRYPTHDLGYGESQSWKSRSLGLDYFFYPDGEAIRGWYLLGGVHKGEHERTVMSPRVGSDARASDFGASPGLGYTRGWLDLGLRFQVANSGFPQYEYSRQQSLQAFIGVLFGKGGIGYPSRF